MSRFKLLYFVIFIINLCIISAQISDKRLCVDEECKVPISQAKTLLRYSSPDSRILSFAPNVDITIYSKSAGSREDLWGGEINGKRGYVPKHLVRETRVLQKPTLLVDTEFNNATEAQQVPSQVEPAKVQEPYEVVDGTTIYLSPQDDISPTSTESPIQSTALPVTEAKNDEVTSNEQTQNDPAEASTSTKNNNEENPPKVEETLSQSNQQAPSTDNVEATEPPQTPKEQKEDSPITEPQKEETKLENVETNKEESETVQDEDDGEIDDEEDDDEDEDEESEELEAVIEEEGNENVEIKTESEPPKKEIIPEVTTEAPKLSKSEEVNVDILSESTTKTEINIETLNSSKQPEAEVPNSPPVTETPSTEQTNISDSSSVGASIIQQEEPPKTEESKELKSEETETEKSKEELNIETTTLSPELEVPQPFIDGTAEVTPNPLETVIEEVKQPENLIPTLPPLGLFGQNLNAPTIEDIQDTNNKKTGKEEKEIEITQPEENVNKETVQEPNDFTFTEETKEVVEEQKVEVKDLKVEVEEQKLEVEDQKVEVEEQKVEVEEQKVEVEEQKAEVVEEIEERQDGGLFSGIFSMFSSSNEEKPEENEELTSTHVENLHVEDDELISVTSQEQTCDATSCEEKEKIQPETSSNMDSFLNFNSDFFLYLVTTAISVIIFLFGYIAFDKSKREGPLIARINTLEKEMLILVKENQILQEKVTIDSGYDTNDKVPNEVVENLKQELYEMAVKKNALEEQVQLLEKELENSTEVGMELNKMLSDILSSESGSDVLKANMEHLQRQLVEQQATINSVNETLAMTNTENHELRLELELNNKKVLDLQAELDKMLLNVLKIEEEKETQQTSLESEITKYRQKYEEISTKFRLKEEEYNIEVKQLRNRLDQTERNLELKLKEHDILTDTIKQLKAMKSNDGPSLQALLDSSSLKAEVQQLKSENQKFRDRLRQEEEAKSSYEKRAQVAIEEVKILKEKYDEVDKLRVESETKLEVLSNYFKDREAQLQKEISKHESLWEEKQGEASSTTERIKFMQEQLQNYKIQTESLKQEIMSQEVELKSQISVLEKKAHENWVSARQAERKLEEAKQEAAQLRHRLTLRERTIHQEDKTHRFQSPVEQNGDMLASPLESPASPPLLFGTRDHITKSPPMPSLPPILPPPPGVPFMPPPLHGVPPFIPPPPTMFPGDHRPPPLGRMSSPPLNSRYSPSSRGYSPYDRNSSSPSDSEYGTSPPQRRGYSPFRGEDRREYKRPPPSRTNGRGLMKGGGSSGSGHSNESLDKVNRQQSKV